MTAKEPTKDLVERLLEWARDYRMNADLFVETLPDEKNVFACRLRPWSNKRTGGVMWFGYGPTLVVAMGTAVKRWRDDEEQALDWAYRPWRAPDRAASGPRGDADLPF